MKKYLVCAVILGIALSAGAQTVPVTPPVTPAAPAHPNLYTTQDVMNAIFLYPDAIITIARSSGTYTVLGNVWVTSGTISTVQNLSQLNELKNVWVTSGVISTVQVLSQLNELKNVWVTSGVISNIQTLSQLNDLMNNWITSGTITTVENLSQLNELKNVWITSGVISTIENLAQLNELKNVWVTSGVIDVASMPPVTVDISSVSVSVIFGANYNTWVTSGIISTIETLAQLNELKNVWITSGIISNIENLAQLNELKNVWITSGVVSVNSIPPVNVWVTSGIVTTTQYGTQLSTASGGVIYGDTTITPGFDVTGISFYSDGATSSVTSTFSDGIIWCPDGIPNGLDLPKAAVTPSFIVDVGAGASFYYTISGVK